MNIAYSSSEYYFQPTYVSIYSLLKNSSEKHSVFLLSSDLSSASKDALEKLVVGFGSNIKIIDVGEMLATIASKFNLPVMRGSYSTYARILLADILSNLDEVLLIDSDTLVVGEIVEIKKNLSGNFVMLACRDYVISNKYSRHEDNYLSESEYFNMGILYVNLKKWRENKISEYLEKNIDSEIEFKTADQSIVNRYLKNYIGNLDMKFNFYTYFHYGFSYEYYKSQNNRTNFVEKDKFLDFSKNPIIIHFIGTWYERPWYRNNISSYKDLYLSYWKYCFSVEDLFPKPKISLNNNLYDTVSQFIFKHFGIKLYYLFKYRLIQLIKEVL